jgi:hypothetical protein
MTTETDKAEKVLADLLDQKDELIARAGRLAADRQRLAFAAHTNTDKAAKERLRKINDETILFNCELEGIEAAIAEATQRLEAAKREADIAKDRADAEQLRDTIKELVELGTEIDAALADATAHIAAIPELLYKIHALGCANPSHEQFRVLGAQAVKTALMQLSLFNREFEHLSPNQRRTFESIVQSWQTMILSNIAARLGTNSEEAA